MPKWIVVYAIEKEVEFTANNINAVMQMAEHEKRPGERIVSIRIKR